MIRRTALTITLASAALLLAACGPGAGKTDKGNPAMPPADPARAARTNGMGPDGKPIDAVAAAEMKESDLPPLKGAGPAPDVPPPPPFEAPEKK
jgi:hypothetical protein